MSELKPCPFCGGKAFAINNIPTYGEEVMFYASCESCRVRTPLKWTIEKAIEVWNRRAEDGRNEV